uniref:Putative secreted protein n=1 Tax=Ixodes scapularis TaxID=6945 RepID=A0A4D5S191_IXOSC
MLRAVCWHSLYLFPLLFLFFSQSQLVLLLPRSTRVLNAHVFLPHLRVCVLQEVFRPVSTKPHSHVVCVGFSL